MKIVNIDIIPINPGLAARNADHKVRFRAIDQRTIVRVVTDNGSEAFARVYERVQREGAFMEKED